MRAKYIQKLISRTGTSGCEKCFSLDCFIKKTNNLTRPEIKEIIQLTRYQVADSWRKQGIQIDFEKMTFHQTDFDKAIQTYLTNKIYK